MQLVRCVILGLAVVLAGCSTERWVQHGKTAVEAEEASVQCQHEVASKPRPFADPVYKLSAHAYDACMESKGYKLVAD